MASTVWRYNTNNLLSNLGIQSSLHHPSVEWDAAHMASHVMAPFQKLRTKRSANERNEFHTVRIVLKSQKSNLPCNVCDDI